MSDEENNPLEDLRDEAGKALTVRDPVCGMEIDLADAVGSHEYKGETFYFCSRSCLERFKEDPEQFLHPPEPGPTPAPARAAATEYTCPMHPEVRSPSASS